MRSFPGGRRKWFLRVTVQNLDPFLPWVNGVIVGSALKEGGRLTNPVDPRRRRHGLPSMNRPLVAASRQSAAVSLGRSQRRSPETPLPRGSGSQSALIRLASKPPKTP
jgi:hypothetical protein